jgi:hypothetical protein
MPESSDLTALAAAAADAARHDDTPAAAALLRQLLDAQTAALGPDHPDLATTLNNLALMLERLGQMPEAGRCYRRAHAIASRALGPDDTLVQVSHANLTAFLATYGLPADGDGGPWGELTDFAPSGSVAPAPEGETSAPAPPAAPASLPAPPATRPASPVATAPPVAEKAPARAAPAPTARTRDRSSRDTPPRVRATAAPPAPPATRPSWALPSLILAVLLGGIAAWMVWPPPVVNPQTDFQNSSAPGVLPASPQPEPSAPPAPAVVPATDAPAPPSTPAEPPTSAVAPPAASGITPDASGIRVVTAEVCRNLTHSGGWRCTPVSADADTRVAFYYTRIATPRNAVVHHRWSRDGAVVRTVDLRVGANNVEGYRTFSRQTMTARDAGSWEVALVTGEGAVLHTQTFEVP